MTFYLLPSKILYLKLKIYKKRKLFKNFISKFKIFLFIFKFLYLKYVSYSFLRKFLIIRYLSLNFVGFKFIYNIKQFLFLYKQYLFFFFLQHNDVKIQRPLLTNYSFYLLSRIEKSKTKKNSFKNEEKTLTELENKVNEDFEFEELDSKFIEKNVLLTYKNSVRNNLIIQKFKNFVISVLSNYFLPSPTESELLEFTDFILDKLKNVSLDSFEKQNILYYFLLKYKIGILDYKKSLKFFYKIKYNFLNSLRSEKTYLYINKKKNKLYLYILRKKIFTLYLKKSNFKLLFKLLFYKYKSLNIPFVCLILNKYITLYIYISIFSNYKNEYINYIKNIRNDFVKNNNKLNVLNDYNSLNFFLKESEYLTILFDNDFLKYFNKLNFSEVNFNFLKIKSYLFCLNELQYSQIFNNSSFHLKNITLKLWVCFYFFLILQKNSFSRININHLVFFKLNCFPNIINIFFKPLEINKVDNSKIFISQYFWHFKELFILNYNLISFYLFIKNKKSNVVFYNYLRKKKKIFIPNFNNYISLNLIKNTNFLLLIKYFKIFNTSFKLNFLNIPLLKKNNIFKIKSYLDTFYRKNEFNDFLNYILDLEDKYDFKKKNLTYQEIYFIHNYNYEKEEIIDLEKDRKLRKDLKFYDFKLKYHAKLLLLGYPLVKRKVPKKFRKHYRFNKEWGVFVHYYDRFSVVESNHKLINEFHELNIFAFYKEQFKILKKGIFFTHYTHFSFFKFLNFLLLNILNKNLNNIEIFLLFGRNPFNHFFYMKFLNNLENNFFIQKKKKILHKLNWDKYLLSFNNLYMKTLNKKYYKSKIFNKKKINNENLFFFIKKDYSTIINNSESKFLTEEEINNDVIENFDKDAITQKIRLKKNGLLVDRELSQINFIAKNSLKFYFHLVLQKELNSDNHSYDKVEHQQFFRLKLLRFYQRLINEPLKHLSSLNLTEFTNFFSVKNKNKDFYYTFLNKKKNIFNLLEINEIFDFLNIIPLEVNISNVNDFINLKKYNINIQRHNGSIPMFNKNTLLKEMFSFYKFRINNYTYFNKIKMFYKTLKKNLKIKNRIKKKYLKLLLKRNKLIKELKYFKGLSLNSKSIYNLKLFKVKKTNLKSMAILNLIKLKNKKENYFSIKTSYYWIKQLNAIKRIILNKKKKKISKILLKSTNKSKTKNINIFEKYLTTQKRLMKNFEKSNNFSLKKKITNTTKTLIEKKLPIKNSLNFKYLNLNNSRNKSYGDVYKFDKHSNSKFNKYSNSKFNKQANSKFTYINYKNKYVKGNLNERKFNKILQRFEKLEKSEKQSYRYFKARLSNPKITTPDNNVRFCIIRSYKHHYNDSFVAKVLAENHLSLEYKENLLFFLNLFFESLFTKKKQIFFFTNFYLQQVIFFKFIVYNNLFKRKLLKFKNLFFLNIFNKVLIKYIKYGLFFNLIFKYHSNLIIEKKKKKFIYVIIKRRLPSFWKSFRNFALAFKHFLNYYKYYLRRLNRFLRKVFKRYKSIKLFKKFIVNKTSHYYKFPRDYPSISFFDKYK